MSQILIPPRAKVAFLLGLTMVGLALWKWDQPAPSQDAAPAPPSAFVASAPLAPTNEVSSEPQLTVPTAQDVLQKCYDSPVKASDLKELLEDTLPADVVAQAQVALENLHLKTPQGDELRLHQRANDVTGKLEVLLFGVDAQGYPVPQKFPSAVQSLSNEEKKDWFLRQGNLAMTEKVYSLNTDSVHGRWKERNQTISQLEISLQDRSVSCGENLETCRCRR